MLTEERLRDLLLGVKENNLEALEELTSAFSKYLRKYAYKYHLDYDLILEEFYTVVANAVLKNILELSKFLKYLNINMKYFKTRDIEGRYQKDTEYEFISFEAVKDYLEDFNLETYDEFSDLREVFSYLKEGDFKILISKYIEGLTCEMIGASLGLSKQRISQKLKKIQKEIILNHKIS